MIGVPRTAISPATAAGKSQSSITDSRAQDFVRVLPGYLTG